MNRAAQIIHLNYARRKHLTGKGIGIAIFDTGIGYHPDLFPHHSSFGLVDFIDTIYGRKQYYDDNGHGTHIAGILAGSGQSCNGLFTGIAPGCHYVVIKVLNQRGEGNTENVLAGISWLLKHFREYDTRIHRRRKPWSLPLFYRRPWQQPQNYNRWFLRHHTKWSWQRLFRQGTNAKLH